MRNAQDVDVLDEAPAPSVTRPLAIALSVAAVIVIADQITKRWALNALEAGPCSTPGNCIDLFAGIKFHLIFNTGAAFTRGSGFGPVLAVLAFFMSGFLLYLATRRQDRLGVALFGAVAGGAAGNLTDRIFRADDGLFSGAVVDFIDVGWWPVFNVADMAIVVGVISIIVLTIFEGDPNAAEIEESASEASEESSSEASDMETSDADAASMSADEDLSAGEDQSPDEDLSPDGETHPQAERTE